MLPRQAAAPGVSRPYFRLKLLPDAAERIRGPEATRVPMNPETDKHVIPVASGEACPEPARLRGIYVLEHAEPWQARVRIEPLGGREGFMALVGHTFNRYLADPERLRRQLLEMTRIVRGVPVKRIVYNARTANAHMAGRIDEKDLGPRLASDADRMNKERARRGLPPR